MLSSAIGSKILAVDDASHRGGYGTIDTVTATVHYYADFPIARPKAKRAGPLTAISDSAFEPYRLIGGGNEHCFFAWQIPHVVWIRELLLRLSKTIRRAW
jgi:hypothetical protein